MPDPNIGGVRESTDTAFLRRLAASWRAVGQRRNLEGDDPGPVSTAIQIEWAAREIDRLRAEAQALARVVEAAWALNDRDPTDSRAELLNDLYAALDALAEAQTGAA